MQALNKTRRDAVSRDSSDQTCRMRRREGRTGRQSGAGEASGIKSVADQGRSDGWSMSHCLERLVLAASVPARAFEPKLQWEITFHD